jgi:subtilase family serine protease
MLFLLGGICPVLGAGMKTLPGHVPKILANLTSNGLLAPTNQLRLTIGLPLRDPAGLAAFLAQVYDPASPNFRKFLTPDEFTARFGPTAADYAAVVQFAHTNGLTITQTHDSRLLLDVNGPVPAIESAFHITLRTYRHPTEARDFYAPDTEPTVAAQLPVADISGLNNLWRPHPKLRRVKAAGVPRSGSGDDGSYLGGDFRAAYVPGTPLTGAGQMIGVFEFDGFYSNDITAYETAAGMTDIPIQTVLLDGVSGVPGFSGIEYADDEVSLDIELAMAMAPGVAKIVVFEGDTENDILDAMAADFQVQQFSCSWGWGYGPSTTTDAIFQKMNALGQSFFNASGDSDAFTDGDTSTNGVDNPDLANAPSSSPYITQVGGTELSTTGPGGAWSGETVWNVENGVGSSGGVSSYYSIPAWQTNVSMSANGGSTQQRNIPDVALTADNVLVYSEDGSEGIFQGTSCAAPLWAGFAALVNQQSAAGGGAPIGFLNPAIYGLVKNVTKSSVYATYFNDVTNGNNEWSSSPSQYVAVTGYDLCSGLGTPAGTNLINALVALADPLHVLPAGGFSAYGVAGGPFAANSLVYTLTNAGGSNLTWKIFPTPSWLTISPTSGTLTAFNQTNVVFNFSTTASNLVLGTYSTNLWFSNATTHVTQSRPATFDVVPAMQVTPTNGFSASGPFGGPFTINLSTLTVSNGNVGAENVNWSLINTSAWLTVSLTNGSLPTSGSSATITLDLSADDTGMAAKVYSTTLRFTNQSNHAFQLVPATLSIGQNVVENGGFETGDFTDWTLVGDGIDGDLIYNGVVSASTFTGASSYVYSGTYGAALGESGYLATLSQTISTVPDESYLLSFWLDNPTNLTTEQFEVNWDGTTLYNILNPSAFGWTNLNFIVTASGTNDVLQFAAENDQSYFGLDDISLTPIPTVAFESMSQLTNTWQFTWDATTGLLYQVQYKTNLLQSNWINLGAAITAKTNILTIFDTNALISSPEKFYRLGVSP